MPDFLPTKDALLLAWMTAFSSKITATPTAFGLVAGQATALAALLTPYATAQAVATNPATRTRGSIQTRNDCRTPLKAMARELARVINAYPLITNTQRIDLGLNPRTGEMTPIGAPTTCPVMTIVSATGRLIKFTLRAVDSDSRSKPDGVAGATIFTFVGSAPASDISLWKFEGQISRTDGAFELAPSVPAGSQFWTCAFWYSARGESGPACTPISGYIAGGVNASAPTP